LVAIALLGLLWSAPRLHAAEGSLREQALRVFGTLEPVSAQELNDPVVGLGRALFWDARLSDSGNVSCASCHSAAAWGSDNRPRSSDARGNLTRRHSQSVFNSLQSTAGLRWLADRRDGAEQAAGSVTGSMGFAHSEDLVRRLDDQGYAAGFAVAFPGQGRSISITDYAAAIQAYEKTLRTPAPFDAWLNGDEHALSELQRRGLQRFMDIGCANCHDGALLGNNRLAKFGILADFRPLTGSSDADVGVMGATGLESDRDLFRVQSLRNVVKTAPYFHDGSVATLSEAIAVMAAVQIGIHFDDAALTELIAFLESLSGVLPVNFAAPQGSPDR